MQQQIVKARVSATEAEAIKELAQACGLTVAEYLRRSALRQELRPVSKVPPVNLKTAVELGRLGSNLNQLAKAANSGKFGPNFGPRLAEILGNIQGEIRTARSEFLGLPRGKK
ncbi:MAG: plasmid mobilization relaxosome protein MobC [Gallionellaceae bacterium]|nr:plasmid mobilization relaxosome protein MobC [Gallionellaceae bacterium]